MPGLSEPAAARLGDLRRFDPLLDAWVTTGLLADGEADLVLLASEATRSLAPLRIALPGGSSALAGAVALHGAVRAAAQPSRYPRGAAALITGAPERAAAMAVEVNGVAVAASLGAVRLRADGRSQLAGGSRVAELDGSERLVFVSPRAQWPELPVTLGVAVLDRRGLGAAYEAAHEWTLRAARLVHVVSELDPAAAPSSFEVDWPLIAGAPDRWARAGSWPVLGRIDVHVAGQDPAGLVAARELIARAAGTERSWPAQLSAAAGLSRALASVAVPLGLYDAHTVGTIAVPFSERADQLAGVRARDLPVEWHSLAETDWARIKRGLLDAVASLEDRNRKAEQIGITVEALLTEGHSVDIWADSGVHRRALQTHLLAAGFGIRAEDFDRGRIEVRSFSEAHRQRPEGRVGVLTGLPAAWHLPALIAGGVSGPLAVVAWPLEADRAARWFSWLVNAGRHTRHDERVRTLARAFGPGLDADALPAPVPLVVARSDAAGEPSVRVGEYGDDAAEFAALADDEWLALATQAREQEGTGSGGNRPTVAYLVDPGPLVLLLGAHALVDRLVAGRLRPVPAAGLEAGMRVLTGTPGGVFAAIRPHLDRLHGAGTRFWLDQWDDALRAAVTTTCGPAALAARLAEAGSTISPQAVAGWASPYRIGPRDPANVRRVADVTGHAVVNHNHRRIHAVMRGVRIEHGRLGRQLASALRSHGAGDDNALDELEMRLGVDLDETLGSPSVYTILDRLAAGTAPVSVLGRAHPIAIARDLFHPQEDQ